MLWNQKIHYHFHKTFPLIPILSKISPVDTTPFYLRFIFVLSTQLHLGLPNCLLPSGFLTNILCAFLFSRILAPCPVHLTLLDFVIIIIVVRRLVIWNIIRPFVTFNNKLRWSLVSLSPNPQAWGPPLVSFPWLLIQYTRSYPQYPEAVITLNIACGCDDITVHVMRLRGAGLTTRYVLFALATGSLSQPRARCSCIRDRK
jgi:hypothetical protein